MGEALRRALRRESFDLLVMDSAVPDVSGTALLAWARTTLPAPPPVILIADAADAAEGADDVVLRPVDADTLAMRVSTLLGRHYGTGPAQPIETIAGHEFDHRDCAVRWNGTSVLLTAKEFGLALLLFRNLGRPLSRAHIMESVWGRVPDSPSRTLDAHVSQVRRRLQLVPARGFRLSSVYGFGYLLAGRA